MSPITGSSRLLLIVWWLMDHICGDWNGHAFRCWNEPRAVNRLWMWAVGDE